MKKHKVLVCVKNFDDTWTVNSRPCYEIIFSDRKFKKLPDEIKERLAVLMCCSDEFYDENVGSGSDHIYFLYNIYL